MKYEIERRADRSYRVYTYCPRLAGRLNQSLKQYDIAINFEQEQSEGIFSFDESLYSHVLAILNT